MSSQRLLGSLGTLSGPFGRLLGTSWVSALDIPPLKEGRVVQRVCPKLVLAIVRMFFFCVFICFDSFLYFFFTVLCVFAGYSTFLHIISCACIVLCCNVCVRK